MECVKSMSIIKFSNQS